MPSSCGRSSTRLLVELAVIPAALEREAVVLDLHIEVIAEDVAGRSSAHMLAHLGELAVQDPLLE
jgi:hypothetical protein